MNYSTSVENSETHEFVENLVDILSTSPIRIHPHSNEENRILIQRW